MASRYGWWEGIKELKPLAHFDDNVDIIFGILLNIQHISYKFKFIFLF